MVRCLGRAATILKGCENQAPARFSAERLKEPPAEVLLKSAARLKRQASILCAKPQSGRA